MLLPLWNDKDWKEKETRKHAMIPRVDFHDAQGRRTKKKRGKKGEEGKEAPDLSENISTRCGKGQANSGDAKEIENREESRQEAKSCYVGDRGRRFVAGNHGCRSRQKAAEGEKDLRYAAGPENRR